EGHAMQYLKGMYHPKDAPETTVQFRTPVFLDYDKDLQKRLADKGIKVAIVPKSDIFTGALLSFLPIALFLLVLYFFFRQQIRMAGKGALNFGKSRAKMLNRDRHKATF